MEEFQKLTKKYQVACPTGLTPENTIMIVEDQRDQRMIIAHHLEKLGFRNIKQANNGLEALEAFKRGEPLGVTISSMENEVMGGIDLLRELRDAADLMRTPFALSMIQPSKEKIMLATETGVDEIIVKPYTLKDIMPKARLAFKKFHNPGNPEKVYEFAKGKLRAEDYDAAHAVYTDITAVATTAARPWVGLARCAFKKGDFATAISCLENAEKRNANYVHLFVERGRILAAQDQFDQALVQFRKAIELSPLNPIRYEEVAKLLFEKERYQESIAILEVAIKHELSFAKLHHYLSQAYYAIKDYKLAIRHIKTALRSDEENITYLNQLGICFKESEEFDEANKVYNSVIKLDPENVSALYNKSILLTKREKYDEALKLLGRIITLAPQFTLAQSKKDEIEKLLDDKSRKDAAS